MLTLISEDRGVEFQSSKTKEHIIGISYFISKHGPLMTYDVGNSSTGLGDMSNAHHLILVI